MHIELKDIHKHYGPVRANNGVNLKVEAGTIFGILGENGAGKSTLMKILAGYIRKTSGQILLDGHVVDYTSPAIAARLGIGMLYQDPLDFPALSVLENFIIGQRRGLTQSNQSFCQKLQSLADELHFALRPDQVIRSLTIGERQQLEIIRLLALGINILVLDEPTTGISSLQKEVLFKALRQLATAGKIVILVSHKLEDVEQLCDNVTVLRRGKVTGNMQAPFDAQKLLKMMFGQIPSTPQCGRITPGKTALVMQGVSASGGRAGLEKCSIQFHQREVIGLAGLEGSGQGVFMRVAAGLKQPVQGKIHMYERDVTDQDYHVFKDYGGMYVPASRMEEGLIPSLTIAEHFALQVSGEFWVNWSKAMQKAEDSIVQFSIKGQKQTLVASLSGGNQQRLLLSFLPSNPKLLLLENPTRGLDVESGHWVWRHLQKYCRTDACIVFSSSELDEIMMVADRVLVFYNGRIIKDVPTCETSVEELGRAIAGKI
ncbi:MAG: ATP-binding cassette domain-containing protein [Desulfobacterales bacterium]|nr:ATP-binding cassette domain-containing protein [Desulfobacterales bacterium]